MKSTLKMILSLENGKSTTLSLASPRADLTAAEVTEALTEIIAHTAILVDGSPVTAIQKLYIQDVEEKLLA